MNKIKELRCKRNLNMRETANMLNIPYTTYVNYEKGLREPNSEMLITLADFFSVSVDYLLGHNNDIVAKKLQKVHNMQMRRISVEAISHLKKYMQLDDISKATVDNVIDFEYKQSKKRNMWLNKEIDEGYEYRNKN